MNTELAKHTEKFFYFFEMANEGSLQAAARKLRLTAPSLSQSLKQLEAAVGCPLFVRSKFGVSLTPSGERLYLFCRKYFRELEEVQRVIDHPEESATIRIRVGTFPSIALYFGPLLIESLQLGASEDSKISLSIKTDRSRSIVEALLKKEIDVALTVEVIHHQKLIKHELYRDEYSFFVSRTLKKNSFNLNDLKDLALLYMPEATDQDGKTLRQYINKWDLHFKEEFELDSFEVISDFIRRGYGVGVLPGHVARRHQKSLKPVQVEGLPSAGFGPHRFFLSYREDLDLSDRLMRYLLSSAKKAVTELNRRGAVSR